MQNLDIEEKKSLIKTFELCIQVLKGEVKIANIKIANGMIYLIMMNDILESGICSIINNLSDYNIISSKNSCLCKKYMSFSLKEKEWLFEPGLIEPRVKWLETQIELLKQ